MDSTLARLPGESENKYIIRLGDLKSSGLIDMTWTELAEILNKELREDPTEYFSESAYRKRYSLFHQFKEEFGNSAESADAEELKELRRELEKERIKVRDERNEYRRLLREEARKESYQEQFIREVTSVAGETKLAYEDNARFHGTIHSDNDLVITLSDIHCGIEINNFWNTYNEDVLKKRLNHYLDRIFSIQLTHGSENAYILISEILSGSIRNVLRIENNLDVIDQFLVVTQYLAEFLAALSYRFNTVNVYVAPGNHSRMTPKKEDNLPHENLDNLVIPFLEAKLQDYENVSFHANDIEQGIAMFSVRNKNIAFVHGDLDKPENVVENLENLVGIRFPIVFTGHRHTNGFWTKNNHKVIQTGCLSGTDSYAVGLRLNNLPEQVVAVINDVEGLDCIYDIKFKE